MATNRLWSWCPVIVPGLFNYTPELVALLKDLQAARVLPTRPRSYAAVATSPPPALQAAKFVYIRKGGSVLPLSRPYDGPFAVVEASTKFFTIDIGDRRETILVDRLKPHTGPSPPSPAVPPRRGALGRLEPQPRPCLHQPPGLGLGGSPVATPMYE